MQIYATETPKNKNNKNTPGQTLQYLAQNGLLSIDLHSKKHGPFFLLGPCFFLKNQSLSNPFLRTRFL